ncbi:MAG: hypothetical protein IKV83_03490 [Muribaculaceae bacterium]|nr:hypothetical protein [Muribaculaceae bacterium]
MKKDFQDKIDEYILGRMTDEEKAQFEAEVNQDESIREQLEFTRNVKGAISSREDKMAKLKMMHRMYDREHQQEAASMRATGTDDCQYSPAPQNDEEKKPSKRIWWWASGIAAVLVIGLFVVSPSPLGFSPSFKGNPNEMIRGEENDVFDIETPILNDSIKNDTIPPRDTVIVIKEKVEVTNE